jgi:hypothetical protein
MWNRELHSKLAACRYGVFMLTRDNLHAPYVNYEAGAIASKLGDARVMTILIDDEPPTGPLAAFQFTRPTQDDVKKLVLAINAVLGDQGWIRTIELAFPEAWKALEPELKKAAAMPASAAGPPEHNQSLETVQRLSAIERLLVDQRDALRALGPLRPDNTIYFGGSYAPAIRWDFSKDSRNHFFPYYVVFASESDFAEYAQTPSPQEVRFKAPPTVHLTDETELPKCGLAPNAAHPGRPLRPVEAQRLIRNAMVTTGFCSCAVCFAGEPDKLQAITTRHSGRPA